MAFEHTVKLTEEQIRYIQSALSDLAPSVDTKEELETLVDIIRKLEDTVNPRDKD